MGMDATLEKIRDDVPKLSAKEREFLASELLGSLAIEADEQTEVEASWEREIGSRVREIDEGGVEGVRAEDVHDAFRQQRSS
jgi:putative addiction module component (TIGR02574 family)